MMRRKAVFFYCTDLTKDPVAARVLDAVRRVATCSETEIVVDDSLVLACDDVYGNVLYHVRTADVISHDYRRYLPLMNGAFSDCWVASVVNWHAGANAPSAVLCAHTTSDVATANFSPSDPLALTALLCALERGRTEAGLDDFRTLFEATHWSGIVYGQDPRLVVQYGVPLIDVEIGSERQSWEHPLAAQVVAGALLRIFEPLGAVRPLLCVGGVHFEPAFVDPVLHPYGVDRFAVGHILANQWLDAYTEDDAQAKLHACVGSIRGGIGGIVFHRSLKSALKSELRRLGMTLGIPVFAHQRLRDPAPIV